jgi:acyl carrier protein
MNDRLLADLADIIRSVARVSADVELGAETRLIEDLSIDSLDLVGIILKIQDDYGVSIDEDDVPTLTTLGSLAAYVENRRGAAAA